MQSTSNILLAASEPLPQWEKQWLYFLALAVPLLLGAIGSLVWLVKFRKKRKRKYRQRRHEERKPNPTLAESGGLPPVRNDKRFHRAGPAAVMQQSRAITRKSASNLALAFVLLPRQKRDAMSALYAFCREVDDVADDENVPVEKRRAQLAAWRTDVKRACENQSPVFPTNRELQPVIQTFSLRFELFDELIKGCETDLDTKRYEIFDQLELYCYRVASVVGLLSIEIFGYKNPATRDYAVHLGKALQLTNILRDVKNDAERGRIYLPQGELKKFGVAENEILESKYSDRYFTLAASLAGRAKIFYRLARKSLPAEDRKSMVAAELMGSVYWELLQKIEAKQFDVFGAQPVRLNRPHKLALIFRSWLRFTFNAATPNYGTP